MSRNAVLFVIALFAAVAQAEQAPPPLITMAEAIQDANGDTIPDRIRERVHVRGVVTIPSNAMAEDRLHAYFQDDTAGTYVFSRTPDQVFVPGDVIDVVGIVDQYRGAVQISRPRCTKVGRAAVPSPKAMTIPEAASWKSYGRLVRLQGVAGELRQEGPNLAFPLDGAGGRIRVVLPPMVIREFPAESMPGGSNVEVTGVVSIYSLAPPYRAGFRVVVGSAGWIRVRSRPMPKWIRETAVAAAIIAATALLLFVIVRALRMRAMRRSRSVATLNTLSAMAAGVVDIDKFLPDAVELMKRNGVISGAVVHLLEGKRLRMYGAWDVEPRNARALDDAIQARVGFAIAERDFVISEPEAFLGGSTSPVAEPVVCVPLQGRSGTVGVLTAFPEGHRPISAAEAEMIAAAANLIALGIENLNMIRRSEERQRELEQLAITDPLTGLYNRRFMEEYLRIHMAMAQRNRTAVSFIAIDLDHFKRINDAHGHEVGDRVLAEVGAIIRETVRAADLPVRFGGEEFLVVMTDTSEAGALTFAARLQDALRTHRFASASDLRLTASVGIAVYPDHGSSVRDLLRVADDSLYESKGSGRDRVTVGVGTTQLGPDADS